jgi:Asp-tRNA(Asn)/Glu-tRNA(Gln) amidotransferase A subunit family amidase
VLAPVDESENPIFQLQETTISEIHAAYAAGTLSAEELTWRYLDRIARVDDRGPSLHAVLTTNARAMKRARELDEAYARTGTFVGPMHGIPVLLKDNLDTSDLPTTAGNLALADSLPPDDAFIVQKLRDAGAIVLGKTNMMEFGAYATKSLSGVGGMTLNAYDQTRSALGSSGGSAVAVAANLATVALGTDTNSSIVGPSAAANLVGLRPTLGLVSRDGIVAGHDATTVAGPIARTVEDAARVLQVIAGADPAGPTTVQTQIRPSMDYVKALEADALSDVRIGAVSELVESSAFLGETWPTNLSSLSSIAIWRVSERLPPFTH